MKIVLEKNEIVAAVTAYVNGTLKSGTVSEVIVDDDAQLVVGIIEEATTPKGPITRKPRSVKKEKSSTGSQAAAAAAAEL